MKSHLKFIIIITIAILSIPLIAKQFTDEVQWSFMDFLVAGVLLFSFGLGISGLLKTIKNKKRLILCIIAFIIVFALIWIELAVGIFNSPFAGS